MNEKIIYFSLDKERKESFDKFIKGKGICYQPKFSFGLAGEGMVFKDPRDLIPIIENEHKKDSLHIIIDYVSCCVKGKERNYSKAIRDIIMCYPEVQFLFDETMTNKYYRKQGSDDGVDSKNNFLNFLFWRFGEIDGVLAEFHQFDLGDFSDERVYEQFIRVLKGCNNMYDASNLRHAIRKHKFKMQLYVEDNFEELNESRGANVAVVVEEEYHQNMFNSYCLYANGFRVFPIITATELLWTNKNLRVQDNSVLIRDYDLQFIDEPDKNRMGGWNEIDYIRGAKAERDVNDNIVGYKIINMENNPYWYSLGKFNTYFVSKGDENLRIDLGFKNAMENNGNILRLRGIKKPLEGIYASIQQIKEVKTRYYESREIEKDAETSHRKSRKPKYKKIKTSRRAGTHSCPLDIYGIARSMVHRAEVYYFFNRYRLAALVAGDALLLLNGFHKSLMNKAYYIQAIAENAMAMSLLGGNEDMLIEDVNMRLGEKVRTEVARMITDVKDRYNLLYNIFNDCKLFCLEKEYYRAADEALSLMVQEKDGLNLRSWIEYYAQRVLRWIGCKNKRQ